MPSKEWRKFRITGGWWRVEWRTVYPNRVGNWVKVAHVANESIADALLELGEAARI